MKFAVLGWNYKQTPIEIRELLSLSPEQCTRLATELKQELGLEELLILSTCNRTELYFVSEFSSHMSQRLCQHLKQYWQVPELPDLAYELFELEAVDHLFRVACSLESMVLGEPQILGQVKEAYQHFQDSQHLGRLSRYLFQKAFYTAKRVRTETSNFAVSISFAAVELAKRIFGELTDQTIMVIGAGEMAELAAKHLIKNGVTRLLVTNRTFANAVQLAERCNGSAIRFESLPEYLPNADIIIGSTGASHYIIDQKIVKQCLKQRKGRPIFFIDIAVPRDIDPKVNSLSNV